MILGLVFSIGVLGAYNLEFGSLYLVVIGYSIGEQPYRSKIKKIYFMFFNLLISKLKIILDIPKNYFFLNIPSVSCSHLSVLPDPQWPLSES